ncbi:hypothetical protein MRB53_031964 [Persea americana]|uniref:Uncharacterized protein n=1 Tax=Persea americana TaxID=3435 RepID=A0ACC2KR29_PERAE|nr:hypothetical protein MRB53_031964 [Persea americana]
MHVVELTGETATDLKFLEKGQVIISTPEKWDALSRHWKQHKHVQQVDNKIRIVALSTSLANAKDMGERIGATSHGLFNFPPGVGPNPLAIHIQRVDITSFEARMQAMTKLTYTAIIQHAKNGKRTLVFVPTRKHTCLTAVDLMTFSSTDNRGKPTFYFNPKRNWNLSFQKSRSPLCALDFIMVSGICMKDLAAWNRKWFDNCLKLDGSRYVLHAAHCAEEWRYLPIWR